MSTTMAASSSPSSVSAADHSPLPPSVILLLSMAVLEIILAILSVPFSTINLVVIGRTSLIHPNLKIILLCQSSTILLRALNRCAICAFKLCTLDPISAEFIEPLCFIHVFSFIIRNFIAHMLIIERLMATWMVRTYERRRSCWFTAIWCPVVFLIAFFNMLELVRLFATPISVATESATLLLGLLEWMFFARLWHYNETLYRSNSLDEHRHSLTERYQLSENIRTGRQLTPTLSLHILMIYLSTLTAYWSFFGISGYEQMLAVGNVTNDFVGLMIELLMIAYHLFLKRDALRKVFKILTFCRANNQICDSTAPREGMEGKSIAVRDLIDGKVLTNMEKNGLDAHFDSLRKCWEGKTN